MHAQQAFERSSIREPVSRIFNATIHHRRYRLRSSAVAVARACAFLSLFSAFFPSSFIRAAMSLFVLRARVRRRTNACTSLMRDGNKLAHRHIPHFITVIIFNVVLKRAALPHPLVVVVVVVFVRARARFSQHPAATPFSGGLVPQSKRFYSFVLIRLLYLLYYARICCGCGLWQRRHTAALYGRAYRCAFIFFCCAFRTKRAHSTVKSLSCVGGGSAATHQHEKPVSCTRVQHAECGRASHRRVASHFGDTYTDTHIHTQTYTRSCSRVHVLGAGGQP